MTRDNDNRHLPLDIVLAEGPIVLPVQPSWFSAMGHGPSTLWIHRSNRAPGKAGKCLTPSARQGADNRLTRLETIFGAGSRADEPTIKLVQHLGQIGELVPVGFVPPFEFLYLLWGVLAQKIHCLIETAFDLRGE